MSELFRVGLLGLELAIQFAGKIWLIAGKIWRLQILTDRLTMTLIIEFSV
eukprot:COSAG02_NODE_885_length_16178_cov_80.571677_3_plen_50_part_00